jgi:hypothetical protein
MYFIQTNMFLCVWKFNPSMRSFDMSIFYQDRFYTVCLTVVTLCLVVVVSVVVTDRVFRKSLSPEELGLQEKRLLDVQSSLLDLGSRQTQLEQEIAALYRLIRSDAGYIPSETSAVSSPAIPLPVVPPNNRVIPRRIGDTLGSSPEDNVQPE